MQQPKSEKLFCIQPAFVNNLFAYWLKHSPYRFPSFAVRGGNAGNVLCRLYYVFHIDGIHLIPLVVKQAIVFNESLTLVDGFVETQFLLYVGIVKYAVRIHPIVVQWFADEQHRVGMGCPLEENSMVFKCL